MDKNVAMPPKKKKKRRTVAAAASSSSSCSSSGAAAAAAAPTDPTAPDRFAPVPVDLVRRIICFFGYDYLFACAPEPFYRGCVVRRVVHLRTCLLYTSPSPRDLSTSRMPSSA